LNRHPPNDCGVLAEKTMKLLYTASFSHDAAAKEFRQTDSYMPAAQ
jgi:hypothetical protein